MQKHSRTRRSLVVIAAMALLVGISPASEADGGPRNAKDADELSRIYVFYSEPPFAYELVGKVRIRLLTLWDRDKMEREIRGQVARKGADVVILEKSFLKYDELPRVVGEPTPRGRGAALIIPNRNAYVEGRIATRIKEIPERDCERLYPVAFDTAWNAVARAIASLGWEPESVDTDSRYLTTRPVVSVAVTVRCDPPRSEWLPAVFTAYVNSHARVSLIRLDVSFIDRSTGTPAPCRSAGVYEMAFFEQLEAQLGDDVRAK